mmetsp:Transcript_24117/g.66000  ORF Transcript_24117/g.66000 Transcript_24117/m.66000 type:complete len:222 (+) Transcript_24117:281-946(+)
MHGASTWHPAWHMKPSASRASSLIELPWYRMCGRRATRACSVRTSACSATLPSSKRMTGSDVWKPCVPTTLRRTRSCSYSSKESLALQRTTIGSTPSHASLARLRTTSTSWPPRLPWSRQRRKLRTKCGTQCRRRSEVVLLMRRSVQLVSAQLWNSGRRVSSSSGPRTCRAMHRHGTMSWPTRCRSRSSISPCTCSPPRVPHSGSTRWSASGGWSLCTTTT